MSYSIFWFRALRLNCDTILQFIYKMYLKKKTKPLLNTIFTLKICRVSFFLNWYFTKQEELSIQVCVNPYGKSVM